MEDVINGFWAAPNFFTEDQPKEPEVPWGMYGRSLTLGFVASCAKLWMEVINTTTVQNREAS